MSIINPSDFIRERDKYFRSTIESFSDCIACVFGDFGHKSIKPVGSSILLRANEQHFVITAAHVIDYREEATLYLHLGDGPLPLSMRGFITTAPDGNRKHDRFDFACVELSSEEVSQIGAKKFIDAGKIVKPTADLTKNHCLALGYPSSKNKPKVATKRFEAQLYPYITKSARKDGDFFYFKYEHLVTYMGGQQPSKAIDPDGMSGGAFIDLGYISNLDAVINLEKQAPTKPLLAGLIIEMDGGKEREIKTISVRFILDAIMRNITLAL